MAPSRGAQASKRGNLKDKVKINAAAPSKSKEDDENNGGANAISIDFQQKLLNVFRDAFPDIIDSSFQSTLQEVKGHLYNRDFNQAFGKQEYLEAYALRWSPSRALCYAAILQEILPTAPGWLGVDPLSVVSLGGGAGAEIVGTAGALQSLRHSRSAARSIGNEGTESRGHFIQMKAIDIANWSKVVQTLHAGVTTAPPISAYASAALKAANEPLVEAEHFDASFQQTDLLQTDEAQLKRYMGNAQLITLMFTLNELYSMSLPATQIFLDALTKVIQPETLLLVVDSPGSYSTITLNGKEKQYPMHWLLDHTLLKQQSGDDGTSAGEAKWQKLRTEESTWFRLPESLRYPIQLENMRYQLHLYRRI